MISFKPFDRSDWMGFSGAENFRNGDEPQIGEILLDGKAAIVILDGRGIEVIVELGEASYHLEVPLPNACLAIEATQIYLAEVKTVAQLLELDFQIYG